MLFMDSRCALAAPLCAYKGRSVVVTSLILAAGSEGVAFLSWMRDVPTSFALCAASVASRSFAGMNGPCPYLDVYIDSIQKVLPLLSLWLICVHPRERTDS